MTLSNSKNGTYGEFIFSTLGKKAPLIFIAGGKDVSTWGGKPGVYMKNSGFGSNVNKFNIYNIDRTQGGGATNVLKAWDECKKIMKDNGITPSKKILIGFSLGVPYIASVLDREGVKYWDIVISAGGFMEVKTSSAYTKSIEMARKLTDYNFEDKPTASKFVHIHAAPYPKNPNTNGDGQSTALTQNVNKLLPKENVYQHSTANHRNTIKESANWILNNIIVNNDGSAQVKIAKPEVKDYVPIFGKDGGAESEGENISSLIEESSETEKESNELEQIPAEKLKTYSVSWPAQNRGRGKVLIRTTEEEAAKIKKEKKVWFLRDTGPSVTIDIDRIEPITITDKNKNMDSLWIGYAASTPKPKKPLTSESQQCETESKNDAVLKSTKSAKDAGNINTDATPPPKENTPDFSNLKYNHRFYIKPSVGLRDAAFETPPSNPAELSKMVEKTGPWYNRYWAYRPNSGPNYGFEKYETTISDNGINLISGVIPYWKPPLDAKNPKDDAIVKGDWNRLIDNQLQIKSPIDIPILLNAHEVGVYNDNIGYLFESENELHMTLLESEIINKGKLAIGQGLNDSDAKNKVPDSSWANYPRWSGIFTEHCLKNSGFTLQEKLSTNIDYYHRSILAKNKLVNHPGNKEMYWNEMKPLGVKHKMFKPSAIWMDPKYFNTDEYLKDKDDGIAIFVLDYHIKKDGTLTEKGKRLVKHINEVLKWPMATISAVPHHISQSTICYTDVLLYMDENGTVVTLGGNTDIPDADPSVKSGNHISVKVTNFARFAKITVNSGVNGSVIVACVKSAPREVQTYRENKSLNSRLIVTSIFDDYYSKIGGTGELAEKINSKYYNKLLPYMVEPSICASGPLDPPSATGPGAEPYGPEPVEPEYLSSNYEQPPNMDEVSRDNCEELRKKYNLSASDTNIPGISAKGVEQLIDNTNCKGGLTPLQVANLMAAIAASESSNRYKVKGGGGGNYSGRYQFGYSALVDTGYVKKGGSINNPRSWTGKNGIRSRNDFINCPIVQELAMQEMLLRNYNLLQKAGKKISKQVLDEMPCDELAGLLAVSHLLGFGGGQKFHHSGGKSNGVDGFGMSASKYFKLGAGAAKGVFANQSLGRHPQFSGEKYFLYPGVLQNGLSLMSGKENEKDGDSTPPPPSPTPPEFELKAGEYFVKFNPATVRLITIPRFASDEIGKKMYTPEEFIAASGATNGTNCSYFEANTNNQFGVYFIPPFKNEAITYLEKNGSPAYKTVPVYDVPFYAYIGNDDKFYLNLDKNNKYAPVPADAKYVFSVKYLGFNETRKNLAPSSDAARPRSIIGNMDDGNMFLFIAHGVTYTWKGAVERVLKIPGVKECAFLDSGNSTHLYLNGEMVAPPGYKTFPNYLVWD